MDIKDKVRKQFAKNWKKLGKIRSIDSEYVQTKDTREDGVIKNEIVFNVKFDPLISGFNVTRSYADQKISDDVTILKEDKLAIIPVLNLDTECKIGDKIFEKDGKKWAVKAVSKDPAEVSWNLHLGPFKGSLNV